MGFVIVDGVLDALRLDLVTGFASLVQIAEHHAQLARIGLSQEGVKLLDQGGNAGLFVHRLVWLRAELAAQRGDHPAGKIKVATLGGAEMLLDGNHLLLADEPVPAAERLRVIRRIGIIGGHVVAHDLCGVTGNVQPGAKAILDLHPGNRFRFDRAPGLRVLTDGLAGFDDHLLIGHRDFPRERGCRSMAFQYALMLRCEKA